MKEIIGCTLNKAKEFDIDKELWEEMEQLAEEYPAEPTPNVWDEQTEFIVMTYYKIATCEAISLMLKKINPKVEWNAVQVRSKAIRLKLKKE